MDRKPNLSLARLAMAIVSIPAAMAPAAADATFVGWWSLSSVTVSGTAMDRWTLTCEPTGSDTVAVAFDVGAEDTAYFVTGNGPDPKWSTLDQTTSAKVDGYTHFLFSAADVAQLYAFSGDGQLGDEVVAEGIYGEGWTTATAVLQIVAPAGEYALNHTTGTLHGLTLEDGAFDGGPPGAVVPGDDEVPILIEAAPLLPGDANGDGRVDINDLTIVLTDYGKTGCAWSQGCMDGDPTGTVDVNDLTIVLANFGYGVSVAGPAAVPEPSTLLLAAAGLGVLVCAWRRRRSGPAEI